MCDNECNFMAMMDWPDDIHVIQLDEDYVCQLDIQHEDSKSGAKFCW